MGIQGLLQCVGGQTIHLSQLKHKSVVIDGHCYLHRACFFAPERILIDNDVSGVVKYIISIVDGIHSVTKASVYLVFDGGCLPMKKITDDARRKEKIDHMK